jgi:FkbM family methyltransferase
MSVRKIKEWAWPFIKNFRTYIDVGALDGDTSVPFVNDFKKVIAFEPSPLTFPKIPDIIEKYNVALGNQHEIKTLKIPGGTGNPAHGSLIRYGKGIIEHKISVKCLDDYNFEDVDFIKIDVEWYELKVCQGAEQTIKKYMPTIMFENKRNEADNCKAYLESLGYQTKKYKSETIAYTK